MATAAEQQSIIQLVVGMVNAAPGADILAELEELIDLGMTIEEVAIAITANPAWSGDTGLFPDYLPNAVFAEAFLTQLIGSEVTEDYLEEAVAEMTASLNAGDSRGVAINDAIDALAATDSADDDLGDAATALANKTEVATYYSVELGVSSDDLDVLKSIVEDVTSDEDAVEDGEAAADAIVADLQPLQLLINNLDDANTAVATFLAAADGDGSATTSLTEAQVDPGLLTTADAAVGPLLMAAGAGAAYAAGSDGVKDALIADDLVANAIASGVQAAALAASLKAADAVTGLTAAHSIYLASLASKESADDAASIAAADLVAEIASYDVTDETVTNIANVSFTTAGDGEIIGLNATSTSLEIKPGFDEDSNPGITALLTAALINLGASLGAAAATAAVTAAINNVANLDVLAASAREGALEDMSDAMILRDVVVPALTDGPTPTEIALELAGLEALHEVLEDALDDIDPVTGGALDADDEAFVAAVEAALDAAEAAGTITTAQNAGALATITNTPGTGEFDDATEVATAIVGVKAALDQAGGSRLFDFDALVDVYEATIAAVPDAQTPLTLDVLTELGNSETDADNNAALAEAIADRNTAKAAADDLEVLTDAVDDAEDAFGDAGFGVPVTLGAIASATSADDVFLANDADSQILGFAGDDQLFLGDVDLVLNADTTAGDEGDNDVVEYWITGTTSAVITVETSEFGSEAADPETFTITLTGVAAADVTVTDGMLTIAS